MSQDQQSHFVDCPLCSVSFHRSLIFSHAARCTGISEKETTKTTKDNNKIESRTSHTSRTGIWWKQYKGTPPCSLPPFPLTNVMVLQPQPQQLPQQQLPPPPSSSCGSLVLQPPQPPPPQQQPPPPPSSSYGSLRPFTTADLGSSKRKRGLDRPLQPFPHLIVLDFEWTCDNRKPMKPHSEITEFSCVLVQTTHRPASIVSEFQQYVKPEHNPNLSQFAIELTGITQHQINNGVPLKEAIARFHSWLENLNVNLKNCNKKQQLPFAIVTWSDADLGSTLPCQMSALNLTRTLWFDQWINLKLAYSSVYKKDSRGLQKCVEKIGLVFEGRAHSGLVDSINTASIVLDMINLQNYQFNKCTRYLEQDSWLMVGSAASKKRKEKQQRNGNVTEGIQFTL